MEWLKERIREKEAKEASRGNYFKMFSKKTRGEKNIVWLILMILSGEGETDDVKNKELLKQQFLWEGKDGVFGF